MLGKLAAAKPAASCAMEVQKDLLHRDPYQHLKQGCRSVAAASVKPSKTARMLSGLTIVQITLTEV
jgi:hypothetical protein